MDKPGTWRCRQQLGSNDANLRTMIVNPHDLVAGTGETSSARPEAAPPVQRLLTGQRTPLPAVQRVRSSASPEPRSSSRHGRRRHRWPITSVQHDGNQCAADVVRSREPARGRGHLRRVVAFVGRRRERRGAAGRAGRHRQELEVRRGTVRHAIRFLEKDTAIHALIVDVAGDSPIRWPRSKTWRGCARRTCW